MEETVLIKDHKPLLTVEQQIEHLKSKGVTFELCSEEDAAEYLSERTYFFKVAAYRSLFEKRVGGPRDGQYIDLDFGHLRALASLDRDLRYALLPLTLDVEHAARTKLGGSRPSAMARTATPSRATIWRASTTTSAGAARARST